MYCIVAGYHLGLLCSRSSLSIIVIKTIRNRLMQFNQCPLSFIRMEIICEVNKSLNVRGELNSVKHKISKWTHHICQSFRLEESRQKVEVLSMVIVHVTLLLRINCIQDCLLYLQLFFITLWEHLLMNQ